MNTIGQRIKKLRMQMKLTQEEIAKKIGVSSVAYGNWERDVNKPKGEYLTELSKLLKTTPDFVINGSEYRIRERPGSYQAPNEQLDEFTELFRALPEDMKPAALRMLRALQDSDKNEPK